VGAGHRRRWCVHAFYGLYFATYLLADVPNAALNPDPNNLPQLDPKDQFLLADPSSSATYTNGSLFTGPTSGPSTPAPSNINNTYVPWLRKTEYIAKETKTNVSSES
jgi:RNA polymerase II-associated factor 1